MNTPKSWIPRPFRLAASPIAPGAEFGAIHAPAAPFSNPTTIRLIVALTSTLLWDLPGAVSAGELPEGNSPAPFSPQIGAAGSGGTEVRPFEGRPPGFCGTGWWPTGDGPDLLGPGRSGIGLHSGDLPPADTLTEPTVVDVLFLYTPQTVIGQGDEEGIHDRVHTAIEETNYRLTNSLINVLIRPVHIGLINYTETGDMWLDLTRLANGNEGLEGAHTLRELYKADLVCLITELEREGVAGWARDVTPHGGNPNTGFTVVRRKGLRPGDNLLAHELGHLLGCHHDREHAGDLDSAFIRSRKPYIFGHRFLVEGVTYVDVMSYRPGINVPYFSNPRLDLDGEPMGVAEGESLPADGARTINEIAPYVAQYKTALSRIEFAAPRFIGHEGNTVTVQLVRSGDLSSGARVGIASDPTSSARQGLDYVWPGRLIYVQFAPDQAIGEFQLTLLTDDLEEGEKSLRLSFTAVEGDHGIGAQSNCEVIILDSDLPAGFTQIAFPDGPLTVLESANEARVRVDYTGTLDDDPLGLPFRTVDGSAVAGQDYLAQSGTLTMTGGETSWEIVVPVLPQPEPGADRSFDLVVGTRTNTVRIVDEQRLGALVGVPGRGLVANGGLNSMVRGDGRILVWGDFTRLAGHDRTGVALLNRDGTVDETFRPPEILLGHRHMERIGDNPAGGAGIITVRPQPDGKLLVAGYFSRVNGQPRNSLIRLHPDGAWDDAFGSELTFDGGLHALAVQPDGRILVGGAFENTSGIRRSYIVRLLSDGTVDESFQPDGGPTSTWTVEISALALQPDGRILMSGYFERVDGHRRLNFARLNPDGTLDHTFKLSGVSGPVERIRLLPDGRIVLGGIFDTVGGRTLERRLTRLNADGSRDASFLPPQPNADVNNIVLLPDGRMLVSGAFTTMANQNRRFLALLNADGTIDNRFDPGTGTDTFLGMAAGWGEATPILGDGTLFLSGTFERFNGLPAPQLVELQLGELAPRFSAPRPGAELFVATVHGFPGGNYPVETSTDLERWSPAGEVGFDGYDHTAVLRAPLTSESAFLRLQAP